MTKSLNLGHSVDTNSLSDMSKSLAGFHLTNAGAKAMTESTMDQVISILHSTSLSSTANPVAAAVA